MRKFIFVLAITMLLFAACDEGTNSAYPVQYVEKVNSTPDLMQTDSALDLVEGGRMSCGSVSITNSFAWLADNGFADVMVNDEYGNVSYAKTAQALDRVLNIARNKGALPPALLRGVSRYLSERGYTDTDYHLEFQGWCHSSDFEGERLPDIDTIKKSIVGDAAVWLFVGFYRSDGQSGEYRLISHHYVTLVGYGVDEYGNRDRNVLIVHDPAPRSGSGVSHDHVRIESVERGQITVDSNAWFAEAYPQLPIDAAGYYKLGSGLAYNEEADVALLDGVIILKMNR